MITPTNKDLLIQATHAVISAMVTANAEIGRGDSEALLNCIEHVEKTTAFMRQQLTSTPTPHDSQL